MTNGDWINAARDKWADVDGLLKDHVQVWYVGMQRGSLDALAVALKWLRSQYPVV